MHLNQRRIISYAFDKIAETPVDEQPHLLTTLVSSKVPQPAWTCIYSTLNTSIQDMNMSELATVVKRLKCDDLPYEIEKNEAESILIGVSGLVKIRTKRSRRPKKSDSEEFETLIEAHS